MQGQIPLLPCVGSSLQGWPHRLFPVAGCWVSHCSSTRGAGTSCAALGAVGAGQDMGALPRGCEAAWLHAGGLGAAPQGRAVPLAGCWSLGVQAVLRGLVSNRALGASQAIPCPGAVSKLGSSRLLPWGSP